MTETDQDSRKEQRSTCLFNGPDSALGAAKTPEVFVVPSDLHLNKWTSI